MINTVKLTLAVTIFDEYPPDDIPTHLVIKLTEADRVWINKMERLVKRYKLDYIAAGDKTTDWPEYIKIEEDSDESAPYESGVECEKLNIRERDFYWSGLIKHTNSHYESETVSIKDLNTYFDMYKLPIEDMPKYLNDEDEVIRDIAKSRLEVGE